MTDAIQNQVSMLNMMLGNIIDKLPVKSLVDQRIGDEGTGTIIFYNYCVEYHTPDEDDEEDYSYFDLVLSSCTVDLVHGTFIKHDAHDWDELGETFEEAVKALQNHDWLK
jgi:hypothetical protein